MLIGIITEAQKTQMECFYRQGPPSVPFYFEISQIPLVLHMKVSLLITGRDFHSACENSCIMSCVALKGALQGLKNNPDDIMMMLSDVLTESLFYMLEVWGLRDVGI